MINKFRDISPDDIFDTLDINQIRAIKSDIFCNFFNSDPKYIQTLIPNVLSAIKTTGQSLGFTQEQGQRLINITNMMKDPEAHKGQIQSFREKMNTLIANEKTIPSGLLSETPSAHVVDENKRKTYIALQAKAAAGFSEHPENPYKPDFDSLSD